MARHDPEEIRMTDTAAEDAELARWWIGTRKGRVSPREYLATAPPADEVMPRLIRMLDRPGRGGALGRAFSAYLGADLDALFAEHHPRRAAKLAEECRARGDHPHADKLHAALVALMFCAKLRQAARRPPADRPGHRAGLLGGNRPGVAGADQCPAGTRGGAVLTTLAASLSDRERQRILERLDELADLDREMRRPGTLAAPRHENAAKEAPDNAET